VRGVVVNLLLFRHFSRALAATADIPPHIWVLTGFVLGLSLVIAWFKDIPDMIGDDRFRIHTLSLRIGARRVFGLGLVLLATCYLSVAVAGLLGLPGVNGTVLAVGHVAALLFIWRASRRVDPADATGMTRFYMTVWALFFLEYLLFPIAALAA
jgi:homogentisate phytyltransferase/homogentisate geranylgeranyltransferase